MGLHSPSLANRLNPPHQRTSSFPRQPGVAPSSGLAGSWRDAQVGVARIVVLRSRRGWTTLCCLVAGIVFVVLIFSRQLGNEELDRLVDLTVQKYSDAYRHRTGSGLGYAETEMIPPAFDKSIVLNFPIPQDSYTSQLKDNVRYRYGGFSNQVIGVINLLYLAQQTNRVAIMFVENLDALDLELTFNIASPTLTSRHFDADPIAFSTFFDLDALYNSIHVPAVDFSDLKAYNRTTFIGDLERIACWSVHERAIGGINSAAQSLNVHNTYMDFWPLPTTVLINPGSQAITFQSLAAFDADLVGKQSWVERAQAEYLPQTPFELGNEPVDIEGNLKWGFGHIHSPPPPTQLSCYDELFFVGLRSDPIAHPFVWEIDSPDYYDTWGRIGRHLRFTCKLEELADEYLQAVFDVQHIFDLPPFISMHIRRGDFATENMLTDLERYTTAIAKIRTHIQLRIDESIFNDGPITARFKIRTLHGEPIPAADYQVLVTTDEPETSPFRLELSALGWRTISHVEMRTEERFGVWWPSMIDSVALARATGFVGSAHSTYSELAAWRVRSWNGGPAIMA